MTLFCRIWEKAGTENCEAVENCVSTQWEISEVKHVLLQMLTDVGRKSRCSIQHSEGAAFFATNLTLEIGSFEATPKKPAVLDQSSQKGSRVRMVVMK